MNDSGTPLSSEAGFSTRAVHAGQEPDPLTGAVMTPIYATSTYAQARPGDHKGYEYSRTANPTRGAYERCLAALEGGRGAVAFASGMAAVAAVIDLLDHGSRVLAVDDLYGGTSRLFERVRARTSGLAVDYTPLAGEDPETLLRPNTRLLWIETPTNPLLKLVDIRRWASWAHERGLLVVVDNTFATPWIQRPLALGADLVVHSVTKYLNGHSDLVGGAVVVAPERADLEDRLRYLQNAVGAVPSPFDCFLVLRGLKTLAVRMERHTTQAIALARWLEARPEVSRVVYPGLLSHPDHELARRQMRAYGGMIGVVLRGGGAAARAFLANLRLFTLAESLGGVESLAEHPASMTHAALDPERRRALGIDEGLVRLSVGIEDLEDLRADLENALRAVR
jgi:cystathionine gamma-lyase